MEMFEIKLALSIQAPSIGRSTCRLQKREERPNTYFKQNTYTQN